MAVGHNNGYTNHNGRCANSVPPLFPLGRASAHSSCCSASTAPKSSSGTWGKGSRSCSITRSNWPWTSAGDSC